MSPSSSDSSSSPALLVRAAQRLHSVLDRTAILEGLVELSVELTGFPAGTYGEPGADRLVFPAAFERGQWQPLGLRLEPGEAIGGPLQLATAPYLSADAALDPRVDPRLQRALGCRRLLAIPLRSPRGELLGCFQVHDREPGPAPEGAVLERLGALATIACTALENARLYRRLEEGERRARFLASASTVLAELHEVRASFQKLAELSVPAIADWASISLKRDDGSGEGFAGGAERFERLAVVHRDPSRARAVEAFLTGFPAAEHRALLAEAATIHRSMFLPRVTDAQLQASAQSPEHLAVLRELGCSSVIFAPLLSGGGPLGMISLMKSEGEFTEADVTLAEELAGRAALALENRRLLVAEQRSRARAEQERNDLYRLFMETPAAVAIVRGPELRYELSNHLNQLFAGQTRSMVGRTVDEVFASDQLGPMRAVVEQVLRTGESYVGRELPVQVTGPDGQLRPAYLSGTYQPLRDRSGQVSGVMAFAYEVTDQVLARRQVEALAAGLAMEKEAALRSEARFRTLVLASTQVVWTTDPDGGTVGAVSSWCEFTGQTEAQARGGGLFEAIHPDDRERVRAGWRNALSTREPFEQRLRLHRADGAWIHTVVRAAPVRNASGSVREWIGAITDITELHQAEQAQQILLRDLEEKERLLSAVVAQMPSGLLLVDAGGQLTYANAQAEQIWGEPVPNGSLPTVVTARVQKLDGTVIEPSQFPIARSVRGELVRGETLRFRGPDGAERFVRVNSAPIRDGTGRTIAAVAVFENISEPLHAQRRAERLFALTCALGAALTPAEVARIGVGEAQAGTGACSGMIYLREPEGRYRVLHDEGFDGPLGQQMRAGGMGELPGDVTLTGQPLWIENPDIFDSALPARAGQLGTVRSRACAVIPLWSGGRAIGGLTIAFDRPTTFAPEDRAFLISVAQQCGVAVERALLFELSRAEAARAEGSNRAKDAFLALAAHELKTPLTSIQLRLSGLIRSAELEPGASFGAERIQRDVGVALRQVRRLGRLVGALLEVAHATQGTAPVVLEPVDLGALLHEVAGRLAPEAAAAGAVLETSAAQALVGQWDRARLEQVVCDLVSTAIHSGAGGPISLRASPVAGGAELVVRGPGAGSGPGPREDDGGEAGGLGLAITRQIVALLGGTVEVSGSGGAGARFVVRLPLAPPGPEGERRRS